jgi:hypothetical protein
MNNGECEHCGGPLCAITGPGGFLDPEADERLSGCPDPYCGGFLVDCGRLTAELAARHEPDLGL